MNNTLSGFNLHYLDSDSPSHDFERELLPINSRLEVPEGVRLYLQKYGYEYRSDMPEIELRQTIERIEDQILSETHRVIDQAHDNNFSVLGIPNAIEQQLISCGCTYNPELTPSEIENLLFEFEENQLKEEYHQELTEKDRIEFDVDKLLLSSDLDDLLDEPIDSWNNSFDLEPSVEHRKEVVRGNNPLIFDPYAENIPNDLHLSTNFDESENDDEVQKDAPSLISTIEALPREPIKIPQFEESQILHDEKIESKESVPKKPNFFKRIKENVVKKSKNFYNALNSKKNDFSDKIEGKTNSITSKLKNFKFLSSDSNISGKNTSELANSINAFRNKHLKKSRIDKFFEFMAEDYTKQNWYKKAACSLGVNAVIGSFGLALASASVLPLSASITTVALLKATSSYKIKHIKNLKKLIENSEDTELQLQYKLLTYDPHDSNEDYLKTLEELVKNYNFTSGFLMPDKFDQLKRISKLSALKSTGAMTALSLLGLPILSSIDFSETSDFIANSIITIKDKWSIIKDDFQIIEGFKPESFNQTNLSISNSEIKVPEIQRPVPSITYNLDEIEITNLQKEIKLDDIQIPVTTELSQDFQAGQEVRVSTNDKGLKGRLKARSADLKTVISKLKCGTKLIFTGAEKFASCDGETLTFLEVKRAGKTFWVCKDYLT